MKQQVLLYFVIGILTLGQVGVAQAEVSQRDQQEAAQRAYEASADSYNEAAEGFESFKKGAETTRDAAIEIIKSYIKSRK